MTQDMIGKTVVITGASSGIGAAAARELAAAGATVVPIGRNPERTTAIADELGVQPLFADFGKLSDVRRLAEHLLERCSVIDVLAHNAGGLIPERQVSQDGHEMTFQTNYLAPFLLQSLLHDRLSASRARVIVTSSAAHRMGHIDLDDLEFSRRTYSPFPVYGAAKLADLIFAREIARRTAETGITGVAFHPGLVTSSFAGDAKGLTGLLYRTGLIGLVSINNAAGAAPLVHLASVPDATSVNGQYFNRLRGNAATSQQANDEVLSRQLWAATEAILGILVLDQ
jgi:NAD(P)-dependent dehydrogenase (short-subunit alcohol dehydrogenase family)